MPRRDGLPTNIEMLADFTETARRFYIAAFQAVSDEGFHPGFIDKPLDSIIVTDERLADSAFEDIASSIALEALTVTPFGKNELDEPLAGAERDETPPEATIKYRAAVRGRVSETRIADGLDITDILVPGTICAGYVVFDQAGNMTRSTISYDDRPSKINIAAGKFLAEQALEHVTSKGSIAISEADYEPEDVRGVSKILQAISRSDASLLEHDISLILKIHPDLPLNGHESPEFLMHFCEAMMRSAERLQVHVDRLQSLGAPAGVIDPMRQSAENKKLAARRARDILEK